jgi:hypothetical protein
MIGRTLYRGIALSLLLLGGGVAVGVGESAPAPTRVVHGPLIVRLTGNRDLPGRSEFRYVVMFKLNRVLTQSPHGSDNWRTSRGNYAVYSDVLLPSERPLTRFGAREGCLAIVLVAPGILSSGGDDIEAMDKIPLGGRVKVRIQPLTPGPHGRAVLGKNYVYRPRLHKADIKFNGRDIRRRLAHLGCKNRPLPLFLEQ